jgi:hypothetical protein
MTKVEWAAKYAMELFIIFQVNFGMEGLGIESGWFLGREEELGIEAERIRHQLCTDAF